MKISLCGDILINKRIPKRGYDGLDKIIELLAEHDCNFGNLETTIHRTEGYPEAFPGGGYAMADPLCLKDLRDIGFNLFNVANNHAMDFGHGGLLATMKYLREYDIPFAGIGANLSEASRATYCETPEGRIAMLGVTSSFHDSYAAGMQNKDIQGRPGVAPLRHKAIYELSNTYFDTLQEIANVTGVNNYHNQAIKEGYLLETNHLKFGSYEFQKGVDNKVYTSPNVADLERTLNAISDAKFKSDFIIVSIHSHQFKGIEKKDTPDFIEIFAKNCIDKGADIVVCHGPHILRGIERYQAGVIFYGLGNFILQHEEIDILPEDFYLKYGETSNSVRGVSEIFNKRSKNGTVGLSVSKNVWRSILVSVVYENRKMTVKLYPIQIYLKENRGLKGLPYLSDDITIIKDIQNLSEKFGTNIEIVDNSYGMINI